MLHDAEDVVHPLELRVFDSLIDHYAVVQLPVLPLVKRGSRLVSGHYADEFAEAHMKQLVIRTALGAGMPLAGTGCAMSTAILETVAATRDGDPFDASSLTEDYELFRCSDNSSYAENVISRTVAGKSPLKSADARSIARHKNFVSRRLSGGESSTQVRSRGELLHRRTSLRNHFCSALTSGLVSPVHEARASTS